MSNKNNNLGYFQSSGRLYKENVEYDFLEDKFRIINSKAFRRLEYKTQVFINYIGDHYRTRLTHSLEVSQFAVYIAKSLNVNENLAEAISLSHDLGHPPFGHAGEEALKEVAGKFVGFDHNVQGIKIITLLEKQFPKWYGLNLTIDSVDGILKHNGSIMKTDESYDMLKNLLRDYPINFAKNASIESQIASLSDDIAYSKHDIDDGIRAGFVNLEDFCQIDMFKNIYNAASKEYTNIKGELLKREVLRNLGMFLADDLINQTCKKIKSSGISDKQDVMDLDEFIVEFTEDVAIGLKELKKFLFENVYRNFKVNRINAKSKKIIHDLFNHFISYPSALPNSWQENMDFKNEKEVAARVIDYIAGMTDRFAVDEHKRIFDIYHY
jgi:dGTPase